jgi:hypothetical protein
MSLVVLYTMSTSNKRDTAAIAYDDYGNANEDQHLLLHLDRVDMKTVFHLQIRCPYKQYN